MALVKCPECGKENVSNTAKACPQCGFNIAEYYSKNTKHTENNISINDESLSNSIKSNSSSSMGCLILFVMLLLDAICLFICLKISNPLPFLLIIPINLFGFYCFAKYDPKGFDETAKYNTQKHQKRNYSPDCPICHSHNTSKISMLSRSASIELFGLASDTIGKQYVCLDCRHKW